MKILVLDNYDSFTYNLVYLLRELGQEVDVFRNDKIGLDAVAGYSHILLSPGPGVPSEAGIMPALLQRYASTKHILGVCLGHQAIAEAFGGQLTNLTEVHHGVAHTLHQTPAAAGNRLFRDVPDAVRVGRYHSWTVAPEALPAELRVTALDENGQVLALAHRDYDVLGVQFHPESVLTEHGKTMLANWVSGAEVRE
ncbi:MAG: anthranilate synthase component II [Janthinobacterium lividum]